MANGVPLLPVWFKLVMYWGGFLVFPAILLAILLVFRLRGIAQWLVALTIPPMLLFVYMRFVEPQWLITVEHDIEICGDGLPGTVRAAVVSDLHIGVFGHAPSVRRIVDRVNETGADLVLMPGDFTYHLAVDRMDETFAPFGDLTMPSYAVVGNHDVGLPGPDVREPLKASLRKAGVTVLDPGVEVFGHDGKYLKIVGLRDLWAYSREGGDFGDPKQLDPLPTIFLEHNPDAIREPGLGPFDLMVAGHTHGGQINLPVITCGLTFACDTLRYGYAETPTGHLFVTAGTGMVGLPVRLGVRPRIDVLNLTIDRCRLKTDRRLMRLHGTS